MNIRGVSSLSAVSWIRLQKFCELTGYTADAVYAKMRKGVWAQGLHWCKAPDGHIMINLKAYDQWVESAV
jgi:hypothetical protein